MAGGCGVGAGLSSPPQGPGGEPEVTRMETRVDPDSPREHSVPLWAPRRSPIWTHLAFWEALGRPGHSLSSHARGHSQ